MNQAEMTVRFPVTMTRPNRASSSPETMLIGRK